MCIIGRVIRLKAGRKAFWKLRKRVINDITTALHFSKVEKEKCGKRMIVERRIYKRFLIEEGIV